MFKITIDNDNQFHLHGRFGALQEEQAIEVFKTINTTCIVNFAKLEYISSAGLGILVMTQNRLLKVGHQLKLRKMSKHIRELFSYTGLDSIFEIE